MLRVLAIQVGLGAFIAAVLWGLYDGLVAYSALIGGLIAAVPNGFLALRLSLPRRDPSAKGLLRAAYIGEFGKLALTVLMFSIVFVMVRPLAAAPLFATFIVTAMVPLAGLLLRDEQHKQDAVKSDGD